MAGEGKARVQAALAPGQGKVWTFLLRTPKPVEEGIRQTLAEALGGAISVRKRVVALSGSNMTLNPDLVFGDDLCVADIKYKLAGTDWNRPDLYEIVAFAAATKTEEAAIVTFRAPNTTGLGQVRIGDTRVRQISWPADAQRSAASAATTVVAQVKKWLGEQGIVGS